ncbi:MAG: tRNA-specific adenosine deaminase [Candidatus Omnitrophica bacterium ADurb.Bin292]|nr:MAG: tRNA-specific adenosine deaminase [Candidatus Omnitrophica bacterium ADurb.Bin292]HOG24183.1 nucleoside deaminase [Candidatus Omnitrophota bacterium]HPW77579.1 nucleoside deaminase [Candidatus Omnitrophota bacterium]HQB12591.1 nucleoside deaminase [Candidatus Omnitrophota bacterium]
MEKPDHQHFMKEAIKQAVTALEKGEVPVGAVVVWKNKIVARAYNQMEMLRDPTAHAEMIALTQASETLAGMEEAKAEIPVKRNNQTPDHRGSLEGATLYVTLEPCPMCAGALVMTKCENLVYGARDPKAGACHSLYHITDDERLNHRVKVTGGVMAEDAKFLLGEFFKSLRKDRR